MKVYIHTDLEGVAMVSRWAQVVDYQEEPERKREAMQLLTGEVNAAVEGIFDADADAEIIVWDGHGNGGIDIMSFHPRAKLIDSGRPIKPPYYLDSSFDALFFVGQHAMAGTDKAPLCHTYSRMVEYYKINGRLVGEFGARAIMAGTLGVPTVFVSGDDKATTEARELVPRIHTATVKWGLGIELALHLSLQAGRELIRKVASEAINDASNIPPVIVEPPYEQEIRVKEGVRLSSFLMSGASAFERGAQRVDDRTVLLRSDNICDLFI